MIKPEIQSHIDVQEELIVNRLVTFDYLWTLFEPGSEIYSKSDGIAQMYTTVTSEYRKKAPNRIFILKSKFIDYNGQVLGYKTADHVIQEFQGHRSIDELHVIPSSSLPNLDNVRDELTLRGKAFEKLVGMQYREYSGQYLAYHPIFAPTYFNVSNITQS